MTTKNERISVGLPPATVKTLDDIARTFYGGIGHGAAGRSNAIEAAIIAWSTIVRDASTHGLANEPLAALNEWRENGQKHLPGMAPTKE